MTLRAAVFASGRGSNFQVLAEHPSALWEVTLLVTDRPQAQARDRAHRLEVDDLVIAPEGAPDTLAARTLSALEEARIDLVLLAGYLRLVPAEVVRRFQGRMLNLHPALLPSFGGKGMYGARVHAAVLEAGARVTGVTVHFVDEEYDRGRILAQWPVPVFPGDTPESLAERIHEVEHRLYPASVDHLVRALSREEEPLAIPGAFGVREGYFELIAADPDSDGPHGPDLDRHHLPDDPGTRGSASPGREASRIDSASKTRRSNSDAQAGSKTDTGLGPRNPNTDSAYETGSRQ